MIYSNNRHFNMSNISLPYKTPKRNAFQIKFQQNGARYWFIIETSYSKISYFYTYRRAKPKTAHVKVPSCQISASPHQVQCVCT